MDYLTDEELREAVGTVVDAMILAYKALDGIMEYGYGLVGAEQTLTDDEWSRFVSYVNENVALYGR